MKKILTVLFLFVIASGLQAQKITERSYNCIFNLEDKSPMEARAEQKGDETDALFDKIGLSSSDSRKGDIFKGMMFMNNDAQTFTVKMVEPGYYTITNKLTNMVLTVDGSSDADGANVIPAVYNNADNQKFGIVRDTTNYRYAGYIIAKHSKKLLGLNDKGSVVQKSFDPNDKSQIWAFSYRMAFNNGKGYLGLEKLSMIPVDAKMTSNKKTSNWGFIAHPSAEGIYYLMNSNTFQLLMTKEGFDKNNMLDSYTLKQSYYKKGMTNMMLFSMVYADEKHEALKLVEYFSKYTVDVDPATNNIILVPEEKLSPLGHWIAYKADRGL